MRWPWEKRRIVVQAPPITALADAYRRIEALKARAGRGVLTVSIEEFVELACTPATPWGVDSIITTLERSGIKVEHARMSGARERAMRAPPVYWPRTARARAMRRGLRVVDRMADDFTDLLLHGDPARGAPGSGGLFS